MAIILGLGAISAVAPTSSQAQIGISVGFAPPPLPIYIQPPIPAYGYIWTPGYWAWDDGYQDYYWVPGTWVRPPRVGFLWTPGYWGWNNGLYVFNTGYWGPQVGFYGGVDYGYGYGGYGYGGGEWRGGQLYYNRTVNNIANVRMNTVYSRPVAVAYGGGRTSFNGGAGGVQARPRPEELAAARAPHVAATPQQRQQVQVARREPNLRASVNHGAPPIAATARPGALTGPGVVRASPASATYRPPTGMGRPTPPRAGNPSPSRPAQRPPSTTYPNQARPEQRLPTASHQSQPRPEQRPPNAGYSSQPRPEQRPPSAPHPSQPRPEQRPQGGGGFGGQPQGRPPGGGGGFQGQPQGRPGGGGPPQGARPAPQSRPAPESKPAPQQREQPH